MQYTSAQAAKLLKRLNEEISLEENLEQASAAFVAAVTEDVEELRPAYDFAATQEHLNELEEKVRRVKHALNIFNSTTKVEGFDITIDEALVLIPQLSAKKQKLAQMRNALPRTREKAGYGSGASSIINYVYANYDIAAAKAEYERVTEQLSALQTALDVTNNSKTMEIDVSLT